METSIKVPEIIKICAQLMSENEDYRGEMNGEIELQFLTEMDHRIKTIGGGGFLR